MEAPETRLQLYRRDDVRRFVSWLLKTTGEIRPQRDPITGDYVYPGVEKPELLSELESKGILEKYVVDTAPACPSCLSSSFSVDYVCPFSQHRNLDRGTMIEHYACGYTDFEDKFRSGNELICPKCGRPLRLIGTEYRKTEQLYHCTGCGRYFGSPLVQFTCRKCSKVMKQDEATLQTVYGYRVKQELRSELVAHSTYETQIIELLQDSGFEVAAPKMIRGMSGVEHTFDMYAAKEDSTVAIDLISSETDIGPEGVVGFFAKIFDARPSRAILIAMPRLNPEADKLSAMYSIETVTGEQINDILRNLSRVVKSSVPSVGMTVGMGLAAGSTVGTEQGTAATQADDALRKARERMTRVLEETKERAS